MGIKKRLVKYLGTNWEVRLNGECFTVETFFKGKLKDIYSFDKYYKAVTFYARLKLVKDVSAADELVISYK